MTINMMTAHCYNYFLYCHLYQYYCFYYHYCPPYDAQLGGLDVIAAGHLSAWSQDPVRLMSGTHHNAA